MTERLAAADRARPNARRRGYDQVWERRRAAYLQQHPWCVMCGQQAREVDHIVAVGAGGAMWDEANWQSLCRTHHRAKTMREINQRRVPRNARHARS
jgi:5-methylcytosine-specific restriction enzyme A